MRNFDTSVFPSSRYDSEQFSVSPKSILAENIARIKCSGAGGDPRCTKMLPSTFCDDSRTARRRAGVESGGMFEIKAECNGIPIEPRQGKQIQVRYRCDKHIDGLETYKMNEDGRYWQKKPIEIMEMSFLSVKDSKICSGLCDGFAVMGVCKYQDNISEVIFTSM